MAANCCGTLPASIARNAKSAELARSTNGGLPLHGPTRQRSRFIDPTCLSDRVIGQHGRAQVHADVRTKARLLLSGEKNICVQDGVGCEGSKSPPRTAKGGCSRTTGPPVSEV